MKFAAAFHFVEINVFFCFEEAPSIEVAGAEDEVVGFVEYPSTPEEYDGSRSGREGTLPAIIMGSGPRGAIVVEGPLAREAALGNATKALFNTGAALLDTASDEEVATTAAVGDETKTISELFSAALAAVVFKTGEIRAKADVEDGTGTTFGTGELIFHVLPAVGLDAWETRADVGGGTRTGFGAVELPSIAIATILLSFKETWVTVDVANKTGAALDTGSVAADIARISASFNAVANVLASTAVAGLLHCLTLGQAY